MTQDIKAVILDCDGVMFDTADANRAYYNRVLARFGRPEMTEAQFRYSHMHTAYEALSHLFPDPADLEAADAYRRAMPYSDFIPYMKPDPDMVALLNALRPRYKTAIATNRTDTMARVLEAFDLVPLFDEVVTARDVRHPKPHPEPLLTILERFDLQAKQAMYIGDSPVDAEAAQAAGVPFVACGNPELAADHHIRGLKEMKGILGI